jgi:uncharacterized membrane protein
MGYSKNVRLKNQEEFQMNDKSLGSIILVFSLVFAVVYLVWLFYPSEPGNIVFYAPIINVRWAVVLPILAAVLGLTFIAAWIGWTMVTTPAPTTIEDMNEEKNDDRIIKKSH